MTKFQMLAAAGIAALAAACAGTQSAQTETRQTASASTSSTAARTTQSAAPTQQAQATPAPSTTPATPTSFTDAQLQSFARAAIEIDPISRSLTPTATPAQQTAAADQIRQILTRNNLDGATYNAIAAQAQRDPAFAQRIASLNRANPNG